MCVCIYKIENLYTTVSIKLECLHVYVSFVKFLIAYIQSSKNRIWNNQLVSWKIFVKSKVFTVKVNVLNDHKNFTNADSSGCFFLQNPTIVITIFTFAYLRFDQKCMKDKPTYTLHAFTRFHNIFQIVSNGLLAYHVLKHGLYQFLLPGCGVPDSSVPLLAQV